MSSTELRQQVIPKARRIVVKMGTHLLFDEAGEINRAFLSSIAEQVAELFARGIDVTLVSSGAIGIGCRMLGLDKRPTDVAAAQATAAVGQSGLMLHWHEAFAAHDLEVAQLLVTRSDFEDRARYVNIRNCIAELHQCKAVPIINENDTVAVDEIRVGENDVLSAIVTNALPADLLVLLSVIEGVEDAEGKVLDLVRDPAAAMGLVRTGKTDLGSGGMQTKLEAARLVTDAGECAVIASGRQPRILLRLLEGEQIGTAFLPATRRMESKKRWIGMTVRPAGVIVVDDGAARALTERGKSLLASGITEITGHFNKGDVLVVRDQRGHELARGLTNYKADEVRLIQGKRSNQFAKLLGRSAYDEVIHRDNMVLSASR
jgi:glutamate 5-kinase